MRLALRGQVLVDLDLESAPKVRPKLTPKKKVLPGFRCGRTTESIRPKTFEVFINQCTKEIGHKPPHLFETK